MSKSIEPQSPWATIRFKELEAQYRRLVTVDTTCAGDQIQSTRVVGVELRRPEPDITVQELNREESVRDNPGPRWSNEVGDR